MYTLQCDITKGNSREKKEKEWPILKTVLSNFEEKLLLLSYINIQTILSCRILKNQKHVTFLLNYFKFNTNMILRLYCK